jgi:hypothetical protein
LRRGFSFVGSDRDFNLNGLLGGRDDFQMAVGCNKT